MESFLAGAVAGYGIAIPVGAVAAYLVSLTARTSLRVGAAAALGVAAADGLYAATAVVGGAAVVALVSGIAEPLRWVAGGVLLALAVRLLVAGVTEYRDPARVRPLGPVGTPRRAFALLLAATLVNPTTVVYFVALVLGSRAAVAVTALDGVVFVLGAFLASASWQLLLVGGGAAVGHALTGPRGRLATAAVSSAVVAGLAVWSLFG